MDFNEVLSLLKKTKDTSDLASFDNIEFYQSDGLLVLAGSNEFFDWSFYNFDFRLIKVGDNYYHRGFYKAAQLFSDIQCDGYVGYSLGGAIATILGIEHNKPSWTLHTPNIGFTPKLISQGSHWRHNSDPIKLTPYCYPFKHKMYGKKTLPHLKYHLI